MGTDIHICPSLLRETGGESGYSPKALKQLSDGKNISCELPYRHFDDNVGIDLFNNNSKRISVSGVQIKYSLVADDGILLSLIHILFRLNNLNHSTISINDTRHRVNGAATLTTTINTATELGATFDLTRCV